MTKLDEDAKRQTVLALLDEGISIATRVEADRRRGELRLIQGGKLGRGKRVRSKARHV